MPRVLIVKTSSLGDVIHTLPALTDAVRAVPGVVFDWVVEQSFSEVPSWHPAVDRVIPVAVRHWRKHPVQAWRSGEWAQFKEQIGRYQYDAIIDAQGLLKSAWLGRYAQGERYGLDKHSARESLAAHFYQHPVNVPKGQHAVERVRQLFSQALDYSLIDQLGEYSLSFKSERQKSVVLLHGTTWASKHWPEASWIELAGLLRGVGYRVQLPWGDDIEKSRAERIAEQSGAEVLPKMSLTELALLLSASAGCVSVDTGLGHLAAAVDTPTLALFGPTNSVLTGFYGVSQQSLQSEFHCAPCMSRKCRYQLAPGEFPPCFDELSASRVSRIFVQLMEETVCSNELRVKHCAKGGDE
ncbi:MAG: lipopolysaccharide heptosyltransferase I [Porticoccus sp.]|nr:lipopolysaccharide heptosyltransferase I [Porticoccus sp.]